MRFLSFCPTLRVPWVIPYAVFSQPCALTLSGLYLRTKQAGDTVAMWLPESSEKHVAQLAAARIGMVVADVDHKLSSVEAIAKVLEDSGAVVRRFLVTKSGDFGSVFSPDRVGHEW